MLLADKYKQIKEENQQFKGQMFAALEIDIPIYSKYKRGYQHIKREQITVITQLIQIVETELVMLWFTNKFIAAIGKVTKLEPQALNKALKNLKKK